MVDKSTLQGTDTQDHFERRVRLLIDRVLERSRSPKGQSAVCLASSLVEYAAFELAATDSPVRVARLIEISAELDRMVHQAAPRGGTGIALDAPH